MPYSLRSLPSRGCMAFRRTSFKVRASDITALEFVICVLIAVTPLYAKDLINHRFRNHAPNHYQQQRWLHDYTSKVFHSNATYDTVTDIDFESSIVSWTGAKISSTQSLQRLEQLAQPQDLLSSQRQNKQRQQQQQQQQPQQQEKTKAKNQQHGTRHKTKSGLLIESNIDTDFSSSTPRHYERSYKVEGDEVHNVEQEEEKSSPSQLSAASSSASATTNASVRKRNRVQNQRKRNGRHGSGSGQRQKLQRNETSHTFTFEMKD
uniref:Uncharacterized protein n=1 Tax=Glossina austeni TaxID=7395 RepID=A0A1A9UCK2_GLOAU